MAPERADASLAHYCIRQTGRHLLLLVRSPGEIVNPLLFFLLVIILFPLGLGPDPEMLSALAPGIVWVVALLANVMLCMRLFADDFADGSLEQLAIASFCAKPVTGRDRRFRIDRASGNRSANSVRLCNAGPHVADRIDTPCLFDIGKNENG